MGLLWMSACLSPPPTELSSIHDAPTTDAMRMTFTAVSHPRYAGALVSEYDPPRGGPTIESVLAVAPLMPAGEPVTHDTLIPAWVMTMGGRESLRPWFQRLAVEFDGHTVHTLQALPNREGTGWSKAIQDAEQRHGIHSHPNARVFSLPDLPPPSKRKAR